MNRIILLCDEDGFTERLRIQARPQKEFEAKLRFDRSELVAEISWSSDENNGRTGTRTTLRPVNSIELRALGVACIELAREMEDVQRGKVR